MTSNKDIVVIKMSGEKDLFDASKLRHSLKRSGAKDKDIEQVVHEVEDILYDGITTKEIYKKAFALMRKKHRPSAARYKLKKAIMELGPSGFPFERYVGEILKSNGFNVQVDQIVKGHCVQHEVDVVAEKEDKHFMVECKYHGQGKVSDVKVPLYIYGRFVDVEREWKKKEGHRDKFHQGWIFTNTRFTSDAIQYGTCMNLRMVSWDYPEDDCLKNMIDRSGLHPVTCLTTLTKKEKQYLLDQDVVLCKTLCERQDILDTMRMTPSRKRKILEEAMAVCQGDKN